MITHLIKVNADDDEEEEVKQPLSFIGQLIPLYKHRPAWMWPKNAHKSVHISGKHGYNEYVNKCRFKPGAYVGQKDSGFPLSKDNVWRVLYLQECHWLVEWHPSGAPKILHCANANGKQTTFSPDEVFGIVNPPYIIEGHNDHA